MTDRHGTPLAVVVSGANEHDVRYLLPLVLSEFPRLGGTPGRPREKPALVRADASSTSKDLLTVLAHCGIRAEIPQRGQHARPGLGKHRWPVERTLAWLKQYRAVGVRRDRRSASYQAQVQIACGLIAYKQLIRNQF